MSIKVIYGNKQSNAEIITLAQAKANSRIEYTDEDDLLQLLIDSATDEIENYLNAPVILRENSSIKIPNFDCQYSINIPMTIQSVQYKDDQGNTQTISTDNWTFEAKTLTLDIERPSDFKELIITANIGYDQSEIPADIKRAALLIFSHSETYRESMTVKFNQSAYNLLRNYKVEW